MTTHVIVSIFDTKAEVFWEPRLAKNSADFIRQVQVSAKNSDSMLHKFPADYELFVLGEWSETKGIVSNNQKRLGSVLDLCPLS